MARPEAESSTEAWDAFFSYRSLDWPRARPLVVALQARGVRVWVDTEGIRDLDNIQQRIETGLRRAKALIVWYSPSYLSSRPCEWELRAAIEMSLPGRQVLNRILVVNAGAPSVAHIHPEVFRNQRLVSVDAEPGDVAASLEAAIGKLTQTFGDVAGEARRPRIVVGEPSRALTSAGYFVGRVPELWRILDGLHADEYAMVAARTLNKLVQVFGLAGIGKSMLAEEYALRFASLYPGGIYWLNARGDRAAQFRVIAGELDLPVQGVSADDIEAALRRRLRASEVPYLWIVDDPDPAAPERELAHWYPRDEYAHVLVTRNTRPADGQGTSFELEHLPADAALRLLTRLVQPADDSESRAAADICTQLGHHSQAIDIASAALASFPDQPRFGRYLERLHHPTKDELEFAASVRGELPNGHEASIAATLLPAIRDQEETARLVLALAAQLARAPIPARLIIGVLAAVRRVDTEAVGDDWRAALGRLEKRALVRRLSDIDSISVHALVSRTVQRSGFASQTAGQLRAAAVDVLHRMLAPDGSGPAESALLAHARHLLAQDPDTKDEVWLAAAVAAVDEDAGAYQSAHALWDRAFNGARRLLGDGDSHTLTLLGRLATAKQNLGDLDGAIPLMHIVADARRRAEGDEHPLTLHAVNNLAVALRRLGNAAEARTLHEHVLAIQRRTLGTNDADTLVSLNNLSGCLQDLGQYESARQTAEEALAAWQRTHGDEHPNTILSMNTLALVLKDLGRDAEAGRLLQQVVDLQRRLRGEEHPLTLVSMNNLAMTMLYAGDPAAARALAEQALDGQMRLLGETHPDTLASLNGLGLALRRLGDMPGARAVFDRSLELHRRALGEDHPTTITAAGNAASVLGELGEDAAEVAAYEAVIRTSERALGASHPQTLNALSNLASSWQRQGNLGRARVVLEHLVPLQQQTLGEAHPDTLLSMCSLGDLIRYAEPVASRALLERTLGLQRSVLGNDNPETEMTAMHLLETLRALRDEAAMKPLEDEIDARVVRRAGADSEQRRGLHGFFDSRRAFHGLPPYAPPAGRATGLKDDFGSAANDA